jgi:hypothetical protein
MVRTLIAVSAFALLGGCVGKPGGAITSEKDGLSALDPSSTHATVVLGNDTTVADSPMGVETSSMTKGKLQETNGGSALKQRAAFSIGDLQAMLSAAADFDIAGIDAKFTDSKLVAIHVDKLATSSSAVQRAVNEGIATEVAAWMKASDNEKEIKLADIQARAKVGDSIAQGALAIITKLAVPGVP